MLQANVSIGFNAHRRNSPCVLSPNCQLLFLVSLMSHPLTYYYDELMPTPCRIPNGVKARRQANALARINTTDFHIRNNSIGRLWTLNSMENARHRIFDIFAEDRHGGLDDDICQCITRMIEASVEDRGNEANQRAANNAR